jgi:hypothetical protein
MLINALASLTAQAVRRPPHDQHHQQADVRQYFGPAFLVDGASLALASPRLMNGARHPSEKALAQATKTGADGASSAGGYRLSS